MKELLGFSKEEELEEELVAMFVLSFVILRDLVQPFLRAAVSLELAE